MTALLPGRRSSHDGASPYDHAAPMTGVQLPALVRLRWQMVRAERVRVGLLVLAACVPGLLCAAVIAGQLAPRSRSFDVTVLGPTAFLGFAVLSLVAPLAAGGGNELFPPEQLVAYPIRPATHFFESLLVAPLNLAWMSQFVLLFGMTSFVTGPAPASDSHWSPLLSTSPWSRSRVKWSRGS